MKAIIDRPSGAPAPLWRRLAWFVALWCGGVVAVGAVAMVLRLWIGP